MKPDCAKCARAYMHIPLAYLARPRALMCGHYNVPATPKAAEDCPEFTIDFMQTRGFLL